MEYQLQAHGNKAQLERPAFIQVKDLTRDNMSPKQEFESDVVEENYVTLEVKCPIVELSNSKRIPAPSLARLRLFAFKNIARGP